MVSSDVEVQEIHLVITVTINWFFTIFGEILWTLISASDFWPWGVFIKYQVSPNASNLISDSKRNLFSRTGGIFGTLIGIYLYNCFHIIRRKMRRLSDSSGGLECSSSLTI